MSCSAGFRRYTSTRMADGLGDLNASVHGRERAKLGGLVRLATLQSGKSPRRFAAEDLVRDHDKVRAWQTYKLSVPEVVRTSCCGACARCAPTRRGAGTWQRAFAARFYAPSPPRRRLQLLCESCSHNRDDPSTTIAATPRAARGSTVGNMASQSPNHAGVRPARCVRPSPHHRHSSTTRSCV